MENSNNLNKNEPNTSKMKELEKNFAILAEEVSKSYLDKTQFKYMELEKKVFDFVKMAEKKVLEKCEDVIKNMIEISNSETFINQDNNSMYVQMKPKTGKEREYSVVSSQLIKCCQPITSLSEQILLYSTNYKYMNNYAYSFCLEECKKNMLKASAEDKFDFSDLKYCLKDCYNLSSFNFKAYNDYLTKGIEYNTELLEKI